MALHRTGQTHAKYLHRELQWALEGRTPEPDVVHVAGPGSHCLLILAGRVQRWRRHSQLDGGRLSEFAFTFHPRRDLVLYYAKGSAPAPGAIPPDRANQTPGANLTLDKTGGQRRRSGRNGISLNHWLGSLGWS